MSIRTFPKPSASALRGHTYTLVPHLVDALVPPKTWGSPWSTALQDERVGRVRLGGLLDELPGSKALVVIVHGMGSTAEQGYVVRAAQDARRLGYSSLRLTLRGSDRSGEDIYHAGLVDDLVGALASPEIAHYESIVVIGFSLGGHMVLRYGLIADAKVKAVASVCSPIDLATCCEHIDAPRQAFYRRFLLRGLRANAGAVEERRGVQLAHTSLRSIRSLREWDERVVAPRFGFSGADDYYRSITVGGRLHSLRVPARLVFAEEDPMIPLAKLRPFADDLPTGSELCILPGGHVRFPAKTQAVESTIEWLVARA